MAMQEAVRAIVEQIQPGEMFDSHLVIDLLIRDFSDDYLRFASECPSDRLTLTTHQRIGQVIASLEGELVERQNRQSRSLTIHNTLGKCALWLRV
ncbi:MAG TPA: hypothetical protein VMZ92_07015 [Planctomycetota bacterium]|nr:hypothetical protein [Planctomycetota bacterium]